MACSSKVLNLSPYWCGTSILNVRLQLLDQAAPPPSKVTQAEQSIGIWEHYMWTPGFCQGMA